jgi:hypothetical protein
MLVAEAVLVEFLLLMAQVAEAVLLDFLHQVAETLQLQTQVAVAVLVIVPQVTAVAV